MKSLFILSVLLVFLIVLFEPQTVSALVTPKVSYFLWPNTTTGDATVFFKDGTSKPIVTLWVGYAADSDISSVKTSIASIIAKGSIPYIQSYSFGDNGLRGNYNLSVEFDKQVAIAVGSSFAFVNLETEWDVDEVLTLFQTTEGTQCLADRVSMYRTYAPNTIVVSSPGFWKSVSSYTFFAPIDATLNARAMISHVVNLGNTSCTLKYDGTYWTSSGASSLSDALSLISDTITTDLQKMNSAWGTVSPMEWVIADSGITSCGWGESGQAAILNQLVKNLDCLYQQGFRGFILRNAGPDVSERAMGINNEGMFTFTTSPSSVTVLKNGLTRAKQLFISNQTASCVVAETVYTITITSNTNDYWVQISVLPYSSIKNITFTCSGATTLLATSAWSDSVFVKSISQECPLGSSINITINGNAKASMKYTVGNTGTTTTTDPSNSGSSSGNNTNVNNGTVINNGTTSGNNTNVTPTSSTVTPKTSTGSTGTTNTTTNPSTSGNTNRNGTVVNSSNSLLSNMNTQFALYIISLLLLISSIINT